MGKLKGRGLPSRLGATKSRLRPASSNMGSATRSNDTTARRSSRPINTAAWQRARAAFIQAAVDEAVDRGDVLRCCKTSVPLLGKHPAPDSPVVDHIEPDRGDLTLFWDRDNWQIVSKQWHDKEKQRREKSGEI